MKILHGMILTFGLLLCFNTGCNNPTASIAEPTDGIDSALSREKLTGTWRRTDGSLFILINETQLVFYSSNSSLGNFRDYDFDGRTLTVFIDESETESGILTTQEVRFEEYQMVLIPVIGEGYDGVFNRTGGF